MLAEIQRLSDTGYKEIVLSGINLGTYGRDLSPRTEFLDLLRRILDETDVRRLRISSIEPLDVTHDLVALFASTDRLAPHFHMPLQSASNRILAAMHRWYRAEHYRRRVEFIQRASPPCRHRRRCDYRISWRNRRGSLRYAQLHRIPAVHLSSRFFLLAAPRHQSRHSSRPTVRHSMKRRARELRALGDAKAAGFRSSQNGQKLSVLTLRRAEKFPQCTPAISGNYLTVQIPSIVPPNQFLSVIINDFDGKNLLASPFEPVSIGAEGAGSLKSA